MIIKKLHAFNVYHLKLDMLESISNNILTLIIDINIFDNRYTIPFMPKLNILILEGDIRMYNKPIIPLDKFPSLRKIESTCVNSHLKIDGTVYHIDIEDPTFYSLLEDVFIIKDTQILSIISKLLCLKSLTIQNIKGFTKFQEYTDTPDYIKDTPDYIKDTPDYIVERSILGQLCIERDIQLNILD